MKNFRNITLVLVAFILTGCMKPYIMSEEKSNLILNNKKALLIYTATIKYDNGKSITKVLDSEESAAVLILKNIDNPEERIPNDKSDTYAESSWNHVLKAYALNPGKYSLTEILYNKTEFQLIGPTKTVEKTIAADNLFSFEIEPGQVIYLGDITFVEDDKGNLTFKAIDKFEEVREDVEKLFPNLHHKTQNKLLKPQ